ncbi:tail fiber domain-containing protein, partial [bacterium]|nr:tail fiber domain-containing protein [bacterium]
GTTGEIRATNEVTAYYSSDSRLKENVQTIENALDKLRQLNGVMFDWTDEVILQRGGEDGYFVRKH